MEAENNPSGLLGQAKAIGATGLAALQNRGELFILELEEERTRVIELLVWAFAAGFLGMMFLIVLTFTVVWAVPEEWKLWALVGFCAIYLTAAVFGFLNLKSLLKHGPAPFASSINEMKKDRAWLESLK